MSEQLRTVTTHVDKDTLDAIKGEALASGKTTDQVAAEKLSEAVCGK